MKQKEAVPAGNEFGEKSILEFSGSPFNRINKDWMLITARDKDGTPCDWNTMTASWGGLGVLWKKNVAFAFIRPSRHTFGFVNKSNYFTLSFFDEKFRHALNLCGEKTGRDTDKAAAAGLCPLYFPDFEGAVSFKEAKNILVCKKLYAQDLDPALFLDKEILEKNYDGGNFHRVFIAEIVSYFVR